MKLYHQSILGFLGLCVVLAVIGCTQKEAADTMRQAEQSAEKAGKAVIEGTQKAAKEGEAIAKELTAEAAAFLAPLKEHFGTLEGLKRVPGELKAAVTKLLLMLEEGIANLQIPERIRQGMATIKEKVAELQAYLTQEADETKLDESKVDEYIKGIQESAKTDLGFE